MILVKISIYIYLTMFFYKKLFFDITLWIVKYKFCFQLLIENNFGNKKYKLKWIKVNIY